MVDRVEKTGKHELELKPEPGRALCSFERVTLAIGREGLSRDFLES
jgi:hypothetical protein